MTWILKTRTENLVRQAFTNTGALDEKGYEIWKCSCCEINIRRKPNSGWTNLYSHIQNRRASALEQARQSAEASLAKGQTLMTTSFVGVASDEAVKIARRLDWAAMDDHSLNFVDKPRTKQRSNIGPTSRATRVCAGAPTLLSLAASRAC